MSEMIRSFFELLVVLAIIYGYIHEKEIIRFELWLRIKILRFILGVKKNDKRRS